MKQTIEQGSSEWKNWRGLGIGASDAPVVMGKSPWTTRFELWAQKTGLLQPAEPHINSAVAMRRGTELEPKARALYVERTGIAMEPELFIHPTYPFIRCSLDGFNKELRKVLELKAPGKADLAVARKGKIPEKYQWQLVHQYLCTDAESLDYATYDGADELIILPFARDRNMEEQLLVELKAFWNLVETQTAPKVGYKDFDKVVKRLLSEFQRVTATVKALEVISTLIQIS